MKTILSLLVLLSPKTTAETIVHHGIVGHFENVGACPDALTTPKCEPGARYCEDIKMCTKPGGKCSAETKGCVDIRWNRDVCVPPANSCNGGFCGSPPNFEDCRCDVHGDGQCHKVEFVPHHDQGL